MLVDDEQKKISYCANPQNARTAWCPTKDADYNGGDFAYCEGEVALACKKLKDQANPLPDCPCMPEWNYQKRKVTTARRAATPGVPSSQNTGTNTGAIQRTAARKFWRLARLR